MYTRKQLCANKTGAVALKRSGGRLYLRHVIMHYKAFDNILRCLPNSSRKRLGSSIVSWRIRGLAIAEFTEPCRRLNGKSLLYALTSDCFHTLI